MYCTAYLPLLCSGHGAVHNANSRAWKKDSWISSTPTAVATVTARGFTSLPVLIDLLVTLMPRGSCPQLEKFGKGQSSKEKGGLGTLVYPRALGFKHCSGWR